MNQQPDTQPGNYYVSVVDERRIQVVHDYRRQP